MALRRLQAAVAVLGVLAVFGGAERASAAAEESRSATSNPVEQSWTDSLEMTLFSIYHGPRVASPGSSASLMYFDSDLTASYLVNGSQGFGLYIPFVESPLNAQGFSLGDVGIKLFDKKTVSSDGLTVASNLYIQAPTNAASQARHLVIGLKATPSIRYSVPRSNFTIGSFTEAKEYFGVTTDKTFKLFALPYVNYAVSSNLALYLGYEMEWHHDVGMNDAFAFRTVLTDLQPGVVWKISNRFLFNPYLQLFTTNNSTLDSTALGAVLSAKLL